MDELKNSRKTGDELAERLLDFAARIIKLNNALPETVVVSILVGNLCVLEHHLDPIMKKHVGLNQGLILYIKWELY